MAKRCVDCTAAGITTRRKAPYPGPRCATHHRARRRVQRDAAHAAHVLRTYGITAEQYWELYEAQGGKCYICRRASGKTRRLAVDHDHESGMVRGLLCKPCNRDVVGHSKEEIEFFERAIEYLTNPPAVRVIGEVFVPGTKKEEATPTEMGELWRR